MYVLQLQHIQPAKLSCVSCLIKEAFACVGVVASAQLVTSEVLACCMCAVQAELTRARSAAEAAAEDASALRVEADSLRKALRAMEGHLAEYQAKDTEVRWLSQPVCALDCDASVLLVHGSTKDSTVAAPPVHHAACP